MLLRDFSPEDTEPYQQYHADPQYLRYYAPEVADPEHARKLVERFVASAKADPRYDFTLAIVERETSRLIGCCSLRTSGHNDGYAEFGLELSPKVWGRGLAREAARLLLEFGFDVLKLEEVCGQSVTENRRVEKLVMRLGFRKLTEGQGAPWMVARGWTPRSASETATLALEPEAFPCRAGSFRTFPRIRELGPNVCYATEQAVILEVLHEAIERGLSR